MALTRLKTHNRCNVDVELVKSGPHYARLVCKDHGKHIQWLTWWSYLEIQKLIKS